MRCNLRMRARDVGKIAEREIHFGRDVAIEPLCDGGELAVDTAPAQHLPQEHLTERAREEDRQEAGNDREEQPGRHRARNGVARCAR
jgi:hypothetical protein